LGQSPKHGHKKILGRISDNFAQNQLTSRALAE